MRKILIVLALVIAVRADAQESPGVLTKAERECQKAFNRAVGILAGGVGGCLVECETSPGRHCSPPFFFDPITEDCLARVRASAQIPILRECTGSDCPECYAGGSCDSYAASAFAAAESSVSQGIAALYCDDSFSLDGLTRDEQRCQQAITRGTGRFTAELNRCLKRCQEAARRGATSVSSCDGAFLGTPVFHHRTQRCIERARTRMLGTCDQRCADPPECFAFTCPLVAVLVEAQALGIPDATFCEDVPIVCGDGRVTGTEVCDQTATPNGCPTGWSCIGCSICQPSCGDGQVNGSEVCDYNANPSGCGPNELCSGDCQTCVSLGPCGNGTIEPDEACDPAAEPVGCSPGDLCTPSCTCQPCRDPCQSGPALRPECSPCVELVCSNDSFCCRSSWDNLCVAEAVAACGLQCGSTSGAFVHDVTR